MATPRRCYVYAFSVGQTRDTRNMQYTPLYDLDRAGLKKTLSSLRRKAPGAAMILVRCKGASGQWLAWKNLPKNQLFNASLGAVIGECQLKEKRRGRPRRLRCTFTDFGRKVLKTTRGR